MLILESRHSFTYIFFAE